MRIGIVGGSLAGAFLALELKDSGHEITVFDPRAPWEKPCGGGFYIGVLKELPVLNELGIAWHKPSKFRLISSNGKERAFLSRRPLWVSVSRRELNRVLLEAALKRDAVHLVPEWVTAVEPLGKNWRVQTAMRSYEFDVLIGADGANSVVRRQLLGRIPAEDLGIALGYMVLGVPLDETVIKTYDDMMGYAWCFPRSDHASVGIGARAGTFPVQELRERLEAFLGQYYPQAVKKRRWGAVIPTISSGSFWEQPAAGANWAIVGDAAGHVDALMGEGIPYALRSAHLAAQAVVAGDLRQYDTAWRKTYGKWLRQSSDILGRLVRAKYVAGYERAARIAFAGGLVPARAYVMVAVLIRTITRRHNDNVARADE